MQRTFLVGCPRSGTTLLQSLLASHSQIVSFPETHLFSKTVPIHKFSQLLKIYSSQSFKVLNQQLLHLGLPRKNIIHPKKLEFNTSDWIKIILRNIDALAQAKATIAETHWLEKTPRHLHYAGLINQIDPSVKFIHIIRRGEHVVPSLYFATRQAPEEWGGVRSIKKCVYWWKRSVQLSSRFLNSPNHVHISYEHLVENPKQVLDLLFHFLDLNYEHGVLRKYNSTAETLIEKSERWKQKNTSSQIVKSDKFSKLDKQQQEYIISHITDFSYEKKLFSYLTRTFSNSHSWN